MMLLPELPEMIHAGGLSDFCHSESKFLSGLLFSNDPPVTDLFGFNQHDGLWSTLSPLSADFLRDRDDMRDEIDQDYGEVEKDVLFRDVPWSAYSKPEFVFIKQEKEDECTRLVNYTSDGRITAVEEGYVPPVKDESVRPDESKSFRSEVIKPYTPDVDHSYHLVPTSIDLGIVKCEEEQGNVDIWNKTEELNQFHPAPVALPPRKNLRRNSRASKSKSVSITKAVIALKRTKSQVSPKKQKLKNSVETTPSSSDAEDMARFAAEEMARFAAEEMAKFPPLRESVYIRREAKSSAKQAISRIGSNMKVERSSKRSDHNKMEKKRRQELRDLYESVRKSIPSERFRGGSEKVRTNPSKQQILITAKKYVKHLTKEEANLKEQKRQLKTSLAASKKLLNNHLAQTQTAFQQQRASLNHFM